MLCSTDSAYLHTLLQALLGHSLFGNSKTDYLRNRCVTQVQYLALRESSEVEPSWLRLLDGQLVETRPWELASTNFAEPVEHASDASPSETPRLALAQPEAHCSNSSLHGTHSCSDGVCLFLPEISPFGGLFSFDDAGVATLVVLVVMLQQNFSPLLHATIDAFGDAASLYFFVITFFGTYVLFNYMTAIVCNSFAVTLGAKGQREHVMENGKSSGILVDQIAFQVENPNAHPNAGSMDGVATATAKPVIADVEEGILREDGAGLAYRRAAAARNSTGKRPEDSKRRTLMTLIARVSSAPVLRDATALSSRTSRTVIAFVRRKTGEHLNTCSLSVAWGRLSARAKEGKVGLCVRMYFVVVGLCE